MSKLHKSLYWVSTIWLALGMVSTAMVQLIRLEEEVANFTALGYPTYLMPFLGIWKVLGVVAILLPKNPLIKEWAYAGFVFLLSGALASHLAAGDKWTTLFGPGLLLLLTIFSWWFRPTEKKVDLSTPNI